MRAAKCAAAVVHDSQNNMGRLTCRTFSWCFGLIAFLNPDMFVVAAQDSFLLTGYKGPLYEQWQQWQQWQRRPYLRPARHNPPPFRHAEMPRELQPHTIARISETLGALNTVGKYLVNMTRRGEPLPSGVPQEVPGAIYTISKNVLGRNVTDFIREALPAIAPTVPGTAAAETAAALSPTPAGTAAVGGVVDSSNSCLTPDGITGTCDDLGNCPQLLLNLNNLRQSLCFKSLFIPGVCCPGTQPVAAAIGVVTAAATTVANTTAATAIPQLAPLLVDSADCGQPEEANFRVVGGQEALPGSWPWLAAIFLRGTRRTEFWCGGSLISSRHVLTAAHCTKDTRQKSYSARQFIVRLGDVDLKRNDEPSSPVSYRVDEIRAHPEFSRVGFYNDVAILTLDRPVHKSKYIIPLCLPRPQLAGEELAGRRGTVVGWGTTSYGGKESSVQREAILPVWRNEECNQAYFQPITSDFVCAGYGEGGTDACQGDSGGPLMLQLDSRWTQIGIVSFGNKCGEPGYPGVYTRVTSYLNWIKDNTVL